jgi:hypothetical protein
MNKNIHLKKLSLSRFWSFTAIALVLFPAATAALLSASAAATTMTTTSVVETSMNTSAASQLFVNFKAGASDAAGTVTITFPAGFTIGASGSQTVTTANCVAFFGGSTTVLPTSGTLGASSSGQVISITSVAALTSGTDYCAQLSYASAVTNPSTAGNYNTIIADNTDTQTQGIDVIAAGTGDQIAVTAQISQFFTLTFGANADTITNISPSNYAPSGGVVLTVSTNATSGWGLWAEDTNQGLHSTNASHTIPAVTTATNFNGGVEGTEAYGITVSAVSGTGAAEANYNGTTNAYAGGPISSTVWKEFADGTATGTGTADLKELLDVSPTTPNATDYADTVTVVGDGSF